MIYLCSVYSLNADTELMKKRYEYAAKRTAEFMKDGKTIFCPINHCHPIAEKYGMPRTWDFWKQHDMIYIDHAKEIYVLKMPNWKDSKGITEEIQYGLSIGKKITYIECPDYAENNNREIMGGVNEE